MLLYWAVPKRAPECLCRIALRTGPSHMVGMTYAAQYLRSVVSSVAHMVHLCGITAAVPFFARQNSPTTDRIACQNGRRYGMPVTRQRKSTARTIHDCPSRICPSL